jgi:hypothetical protein
MAGPTVTLTYSGDATDLVRAGKQSEASVQDVSRAARDSGEETKKGFDRGTFAAVGLADAIGNAGDTVDSVQSIFNLAADQAHRLARAQQDVAQAAADARQAQIDLQQSSRDAAQAQIDQEQAMLDAKVAQEEYNAAVAEFGPNSNEAAQAAIDLKQANEDISQSQQDVKQAVEDGKQAQLDATDAALNMADAQREASDASGWSGWLDAVAQVAPGLAAIALTLSTLVTPATWAWTAALLANPITWIVGLIALLVGGFIWLWNTSAGFRDFWIGVWNGIKSAVAASVQWIKDVWNGIPGFFSGIVNGIGRVFSGIGNAISGAFKGALNGVIGFLNGAIGAINSLIRGINNVSGLVGIPAIPQIPNIPKMHSGGIVPGPAGSEHLRILEAGEEVIPANQRGRGGQATVRFVGNTDSAVAEVINTLIRKRQIVIEV